MSEDFSVEELRDAIRRVKEHEAAGQDGVPHELLRALARNEDGEGKLLAWYSRPLHGDEPLPSSWSTAVMVILPNCPRPTQPKQLRLICLGAAACKVYSRMLLARSKSSLQYSGPFQNMGSGRQTVDYVWAVSRLMALDHEWKSGLWYLKLEIAKAFDPLHGKFLARLDAKMGACEELRSWWELFQNAEATLATSWGGQHHQNVIRNSPRTGL